MFDHMTDQSRAVLVQARAIARQCRHDRVDAAHVMLGMLGASDTNGCQALNRAGLHYDEILSAVRPIGGPVPEAGPLRFSEDAKKLIELWLRESLVTGHSIIDTAHLALACSHGDQLPSIQRFVAGREQTIRELARRALRRSERLQADLERHRGSSPGELR